MEFKFYAVKISVLMILVFILQNLISGFTDLFLLDQSKYIEIWRFMTSIFLHGGLGHLAYNLFALALFGSILEKLIGGKRFIVVFLFTGIIANLIAINFYPSSLGASGAIYGIIGALIIVRPMLLIWAFGLPLPIFLAGIIWATGDIIGAYGFLTGNPMGNTGNIAHLAGMFFGFIFGTFYRNWKRNKTRERGLIILEKDIRKWEDFHLR